MLRFELPDDRIEYLQLALPAAGLVARWGSQITPYTVAMWDGPGKPQWKRKDEHLHLSPDGEWVSVFDRPSGEVRVTRVGAKKPASVVARAKGIDNVWTAVAPGGIAVAWKEDGFTVVRALPGGELVARVKTGFGYDLRFSPGGRWLTEEGERVFRAFDRNNDYKVARIPAPSFILAGVSEGATAAIVAGKGNVVTMWDISTKAATATLKVGEDVSALAISGDGRRVLTATMKGAVALWDASGIQLRQYDWKVEVPIAVAFAPDGTRAAVGGTDGQIVVWDRDD
jgi:WD40 repeat protein